MTNMLARYVNWLHTRWPAGTVEKLPDVREDGSTRVPGLYVVGDLTGIPLLKFSSDAGARAVETILKDPAFEKRQARNDVLDLVIVGAGVSGVAATAEARKAGLSCELLEASEPLSTIVNFPKGKPIYTYPTDMTPAGELQFGSGAAVKEGLVSDLRAFMAERGIEPRVARVDRVRRRGDLLEVELAEGGEKLKAHRVIVGIGRSGNFRKLGVPGEDLDKVSNRLHDPRDFDGKNVLVVGGGDSALEAAIAIAKSGGSVTLSYRKKEFSRPKPDNVDAIRRLAEDPEADVAVEEPVSERVTTASGRYLGRSGRAGAIRLLMASSVKGIRDGEVDVVTADGVEETIPNDAVFSAIGREAPLDFFRRSGVPIRGEWRRHSWVTCGLFVAFCFFLYHWKGDSGLPVKYWFKERGWFPFNVADPTNPANLFGTIKLSMQSPSFYYSLAYCLCIIIFGAQRIRRRRTPYVKRQTIVLTLIQCIPLFLLPYILLPWAGHNEWFDGGTGAWIADNLFPETTWDSQGREYWRSMGFILAWPLMFWNVFTHQPIWAWLIIGAIQTFVIIPLLVRRWGKGAYCGWICSCGALAETMGDAHRHKMPHGPMWNRFNMLGQVLLLVATVLLVLRVISWAIPGTDWFEGAFNFLLAGRRGDGSEIGGVMRFANFAWFDDLLWAGIFGVCFYFWFSGRVWCRFACPLAALMHIYARFSQFRILSDKKKCISCNVCTSVCHQGIDVMNFANKGVPMEDPECVRCSACVQSCPTGVLSFGRVDRGTGDVIGVDRLAASPVLMAEVTVEGQRVPRRRREGLLGKTFKSRG
ncbi:MAG: NAD(P)-binding domain-containing protein [Planctomycetes bacterium]|nr:NAD(P)-binding domain-containing protein [Planctomycetota bacterium]